jgi:hypothetical protein
MSTPATDGEVIAGSVREPEAFVAIFERHSARSTATSPAASAANWPTT